MSARVPQQRRAQQRREALLSAATAVVRERGPGAFSARAVAAAAGLPLAAVSYYFPRLDDLLGEATAAVLRGWVEHGERVAAAVTGNGAGAAATGIARALLPPGSADAVQFRYEHLLAAGRSPVASAALARLRPALQDLVSHILARTGATSDLSPDALVALADGAAVGAVAEGSADPHRRVADVLREALSADHTTVAGRADQPVRSSNDRADQPIQSSNDRPEIRS